MRHESNWTGFFLFWGIILLLIFNPVALGVILGAIGMLVGAVIAN